MSLLSTPFELYGVVHDQIHHDQILSIIVAEYINRYISCSSASPLQRLKEHINLLEIFQPWRTGETVYVSCE
jgi:hypothetical protein